MTPAWFLHLRIVVLEWSERGSFSYVITWNVHALIIAQSLNPKIRNLESLRLCYGGWEKVYKGIRESNSDVTFIYYLNM